MLKIALSYLLVYTVWGSTYLFIRVAVQELPPFFIIGTRFIIGGILLCLYCFLKGYFKQPPSLLQIRNSILTGTLLLAGGNGHRYSDHPPTKAPSKSSKVLPSSMKYDLPLGKTTSI